ncbi:MAG: PAS domain-containing protein, partial [Methylococcales bacterium]
MDKKNNSLRASAEEQLQHTSTTHSAAHSAEELLYELQVHQIELEMQNENLRQSNEALAEWQQEYFDLYEFAPIGYLTLSQQGLIEKINLTAATLLGKNHFQLLQRRFAGFVNATDADRWHLFFAQVMRGNEQKTLEVSLKQPNGNGFYAQLNCLPVLKANKQPTLWIALTDITESKQVAAEQVIANQKLRDSETFASAVFDSVSAQIAVLNEEGIIIAVNHAWRQFADSNGLAQSYNYGIGGCYFQQNQKVFNELDGTINISYIIMAVINGSRDSFFWEYPCHSLTEQHWFCMRVLPLKGEKRSVVISHEDITERKKIQNKLTENERHLRAILDTTPDCVKLVARDGTLLSMNPSGLAMIEADSEDEVRNQCVYSLLAPEYRDAFQAFNEVVCDGKSGKMEFEMIGLKNTRHWMETRAVPFSLENGDIVQLAFSQEITERKQLEKSLHDSESKFRALFDSTNDAIMLLSDTLFFDCNQAALTLFACKTVAEFCTYHPSDLSPLEQPCGTSSLILEQQYIATALKIGSFRFEWTHKKINTGEIFVAEVLLSALIVNEKPVLQATLRDITERKAIEEKIQQLAFYDPLTGL